MFCNKVKEYLSQRNIQFDERNVAQDESALAELEELDIMTTPVTVIDDQIIVGFDRKKLAQSLGVED